jgi:hypothetical protein
MVFHDYHLLFEMKNDRSVILFFIIDEYMSIGSLQDKLTVDPHLRILLVHYQC